MPASAYTHTLIFRVRSGVDPISVDQLRMLLQELGDGDPDITQWTVALSRDRRSVRQVGTHTSKVAYGRMVSSPRYQLMMDFGRAIAELESFES